MSSAAVKRELRSFGVPEAEMREVKPGAIRDKGIAPLRTMLAPHLRRQFLWHATAEKLGDEGLLAEHLRKAGVNDYSFVGEVGALAKFPGLDTEERDDEEEDALEGALGVDEDEYAVDEAIPPDGFQIVTTRPLVAEIVDNEDGSRQIERDPHYLDFLGSAIAPTYLMIWYGSRIPSNRNRRGWFVAAIAANNHDRWVSLEAKATSAPVATIVCVGVHLGTMAPSRTGDLSPSP